MPRRLNILYIHSHDTGRYVQPYGHAIDTPNIQSLADQGVLFRQAFCAGPTCSPSRAALLTGMWPHSCGMIGLAHRGFPLNDYSQVAPHVLRKAGYFSALMGVQHLALDAAQLGYDHIRDKEWGHGGDMRVVAPAAAAFLRSAPAEPFFLDVGFFQTHRVFPPPLPADKADYCLPPAPLPDAPAVRADMAAFKASARELDLGVGEVLAALDASGLRDNTLVLCTTDHGIAFPWMKCNLTDHGMGVMMILRAPGVLPGGTACDAMISQVDVLPTLLELLEIEKPSWYQGRSFLPVLQGKTAEINDEIFAEVTYHAAYEPMRAVRTKRWKYIRRFGNRLRPVAPNCDDGPARTLLLEGGWANRSLAREELYDLLLDPNEAHNLAAANLPALDEMRRRLDSWMDRTDDPIRRGPIPPPAGAVVNDPDGMSADDKLIPAADFRPE